MTKGLLLLFVLPIFCWAQNYDVRTFGAKVDGVTDDWTALNNAASAAVAARGTVLIPTGTLYADFRGHGAILTNNIRISGNGKTKSIIRTNHATPSTDQSLFAVSAGDTAYFNGLAMIGPDSSGATSSIAIEHEGGTAGLIRLDSVHIENFTFGVKVSDRPWIVAKHSEIDSCGQDIYQGGTLKGRLVLDACIFRDTKNQVQIEGFGYWHALYIHRQHDVAITGCQFRRITGIGLQFWDGDTTISTSHTLSGCEFDTCGAGILTGSRIGCVDTIVNCTFYGCARDIRVQEGKAYISSCQFHPTAANLLGWTITYHASIISFDYYPGNMTVTNSSIYIPQTSPSCDGVYLIASNTAVWQVINCTFIGAGSPYGSATVNTSSTGTISVITMPQVSDSAISHKVVLQQGSNLISTFVVPNQTSIDSIFSKIKSKVAIVKDDSGKVYYPSLKINQLGSWQPYQGYQVYMNSADTVTFRGKALLPEQNPICLTQGWNLVSCLHNDLISVDSALGSLGSALTIAKNNAGQVYMPSQGINTMGTMKPGQGYQIYVQAISTLSYPANTTPTPTTVLSKKQSISLASSSYNAEHFKAAYQETGANGIILVKCNSLKDGDEVAVSTDDGKIVGASVVRNGLAPITVWGDDAQTDVIEGPRDGDKLTLLSWSKAQDRNIQLEIMSIKDGLTGRTQDDSLVFRKDFLSVLEVLEVSDLDQVPKGYSLAQNYPNPFNPSTVIRYSLPLDVEVRLEVFDLLGRLVTRLVNETQKAGNHQITFTSNALASGMYIYRLQGGTFSATRKLVLLK